MEGTITIPTNLNDHELLLLLIQRVNETHFVESGQNVKLQETLDLQDQRLKAVEDKLSIANLPRLEAEVQKDTTVIHDIRLRTTDMLWTVGAVTSTVSFLVTLIFYFFRLGGTS